MGIRCLKITIKRCLAIFICVYMILVFISNMNMFDKRGIVDKMSMWNRKNPHQETLKVKQNNMRDDTVDTKRDFTGKNDYSKSAKQNSFRYYSTYSKSKKSDGDLSYIDVTHKRHSADSFPYRTINTNTYRYVLDPSEWTQRCANLSILVYVHSAMYYRRKRRAIRKSWGSTLIQEKLNMKVVFIVGVSKNTTKNDAIKKENDKHRDIIQEDYIDSYYNLTLKAMSALKFIHTHCPRVPLIIKTDDDVYINIPKLIHFLQTNLSKLYINTDKFMICNRRSEEEPIREPSMWMIPEMEYKYMIYPTYCQGVAFFMSSQAAHAIFSVSNGHEFFRLDDVFLTGMLGEKAGVAYIGINQEYPGPGRFRGQVRNADDYLFSPQRSPRFPEWWKKHIKDVV